MSDVTFSNAVSAYNRANGGIKTESMSSSLSTPQMPGVTKNDMQPSFSDLVGGALQSSAATGYKSEEVSTRAIANEADLHELVTSVSNAELTLNTVVAIRDRMVSAYQEIVKMPI